MIGRWEMVSTWGKPPEGKGFVVRIGPLLERVMKTEKKAIEISMCNVCVKTGIRSLERLRNADTRYPCLVLEGAENPSKRKYRMIDGKHRVHKLVARGVNKVRCFVLKLNAVGHKMRAAPLTRHTALFRLQSLLHVVSAVSLTLHGPQWPCTSL